MLKDEKHRLILLRVFFVFFLAIFTPACDQLHVLINDDMQQLKFRGIKTAIVNENGFFELNWQKNPEKSPYGNSYNIYLIETDKHTTEPNMRLTSGTSSLLLTAQTLKDDSVRPFEEGVLVGSVKDSGNFVYEQPIDPTHEYIFEARLASVVWTQKVSRMKLQVSFVMGQVTATIVDSTNIAATWPALDGAREYKLYVSPFALEPVKTFNTNSASLSFEEASLNVPYCVRAVRGVLTSKDCMPVPGIGSDWKAKITGISAGPDAWVKRGDSLNLTVTFSEIVNVDAAANLRLLVDLGTKRVASYLSGSGTKDLTFAVNVQAGDSSEDLSNGLSIAIDDDTFFLDKMDRKIDLTLPSNTKELLSGTRVDGILPIAPTGVSLVATDINLGQYLLSWGPSVDTHLSQYKALACTDTGCSTSCVDLGQTSALSLTADLTPNQSYFACVRGEDLAGNVSAYAHPVLGSMVDVTPPLVDAGVDQKVKQTTVLAGSGSNGMTYTWSKVSGPGNLTFGDEHSFASSISASLTGTYVVRLTAVDRAGNTASDAMQLIWDTNPPSFLGLAEVLKYENKTEAILFWRPATDTYTKVQNIVYEVCVQTTAGACAANFVTAYTVPPYSTEWHVTGLDPLVTYGFMVRARDDLGNRDSNTIVIQDALPHSGITDIKVGTTHSCALLSNKTVKCWGDNAAGNLGDGTIVPRMSPTLVQGLSNVDAISLFALTTCALIHDGTVQCWGDNTLGQVGDGTMVNRLFPTAVAGITSAKSVGVGSLHACVLDNVVAGYGTVKCWGDGSSGQLGNGLNASSLTSVTALTDASFLAVGANHNCAIVNGPAVKCWGLDSTGQLGDGGTTNQNSPIAIASLATATKIYAGTNHSCAILADTTARCWGRNDEGQLGNGGGSAPVTVSGLTSVSQMSVGPLHSCALLTNGTVYCWGVNQGTYALGIGAVWNKNLPQLTAISGAVSISSGGNQSCVVLSNGTAKCWGLNPYGQLGDGMKTPWLSPRNVESLSNVVEIAEGFEQGCALIVGGTVKCWGYNDNGQIGDGTHISKTTPTLVPGLVNVTKIQSGQYHFCALISDGTIKCWGYNNSGQLGNSNQGVDSSTPSLVTGITNAIGLSSHAYNNCALLGDKTVRCWGEGVDGQLGNASSSASGSPVVVTGLTNVAAVGTGNFHSCALKDDGTVQCWGVGSLGRLGDGTSNPSNVPVSVAGLTGVTKLFVGARTNCAFKADGNAYCWGANDQAIMGTGNFTSLLVPTLLTHLQNAKYISMEYYRMCAVLSDDTVKCGGWSNYGGLGNGVNNVGYYTFATTGNIGNARSISGYDNKSCAVLTDGKVKCWGTPESLLPIFHAVFN